MLGSFEYRDPRTIAEACRLLAGEDSACLLAGGTDLFIELRAGWQNPELLIDIKGIDALGELRTEEDGTLSIGAAVPLDAIARSPVASGPWVALREAALSIGTQQLRHRATLAGNLCNGSPAADTAPVLLTLGAYVMAASLETSRQIDLANFFTGVKRTALRNDEMICEVRIPPQPPGLRTAFLKQQRVRGHDLAVVNVAGALDPSSGDLRVAIGSCSPTPILLPSINAAGVSPTALSALAIESALDHVSPIDDVRASAGYRKAVLETLIDRLIARLVSPEGGA